MTQFVSAPPAVDTFGLTDTGKVRETNEDHFLIAAMRKSVDVRYTSLPGPVGERFPGAEAFVFAVADGVGGQPGGELASEATVDALLRSATGVAGCFHTMDAEQEQELLAKLERSTLDVHEKILVEHGRSNFAPATTLTLALLAWPRTYFIHVGDSRAYYLRRGRLLQLTRDQTLGEYMMDVGVWTAEQAARAPGGASLSSAVGGSEIAPALGLIDLEPGDVLLLCTDGLVKHVPDPQIAEVLGQDVGAEAMCRELVTRALAGGGSDNVTAVVARMGR
jgi:protein phosphatase